MRTLRYVVKAPVPSLNALLRMGVHARIRLKHGIQESVLSSLRAIDGASSTPTTSSQNTTLMPSDTLDAYIRMRRTRRRSPVVK